jgi:hypothetical protein
MEQPFPCFVKRVQLLPIRHPVFEYVATVETLPGVPKPDLPLPVLTPAASAALDRAYQFAYGRLVAARITDARSRLVEAFGDLYSQERVARVIGKSQTWLSNLEVGQRRIDTSALLILAAVYGVPLEMLVMPPTGKREGERMSRWIREYRALLRGGE